MTREEWIAHVVALKITQGNWRTALELFPMPLPLKNLVQQCVPIKQLPRFLVALDPARDHVEAWRSLVLRVMPLIDEDAKGDEKKPKTHVFFEFFETRRHLSPAFRRSAAMINEQVLGDIKYYVNGGSSGRRRPRRREIAAILRDVLGVNDAAHAPPA